MYKCSVCLLLGDDRFHDIDTFSSYTDLETEEVQEVLGLPDGITLTEESFEQVKTFSLLSDGDQAMMIAYHEATGSFDWEEAQEAYVMTCANDADFAYSLCDDMYSSELKAVPSFIKNHIDWQEVWDSELRYDHFAHNGYYFRNI